MSSVPLPLEMRAKPVRKVVLVLGWLFLMAGCGYSVLTGGVVYAMIGLFGLAFFGYAGVKLFRQRSELAGLTLTDKGVRPLGWSTEIPWSVITEVGVGKYGHNKLVGFNVADYDRLLALMSQTQLREMNFLRHSVIPLSVAMVAVGESPGDLPGVSSSQLKDTLAASRRIIGWDVIAMQTYLDRPVEVAASLLEDARIQQTLRPPPT